MSKIGSIASQLPTIVVVAVLIFGGIFAYKEISSLVGSIGLNLNDDRFDAQQRRIDELNRQYLQLAENVVRAQTKILSPKEMKRLVEETISPLIREQLEKDNAEIQSLSTTMARLEGKIDMAVAGTFRNVDTTRTGERFNLFTDYARFADQDGKPGIRVAQVNFDAADLDSPWTIVTEDLRIEASTVVAQQRTGNFEAFVELNAYNSADPNYRTHPYRIKVDTSLYFQRELKDAEWFVFSPHLEGGLGSNFSVGTPTIGFDIGISLIAYGKTAHDNYLRFLRVGIGFTDNSDSIFGSFSPIGLNVRTIGVPFLKDTWFFPGLSLKKNGGIGFAANLSTTF